MWRERYAQRYDMLEKKGGKEIMMLYKLRSKLLGKSAIFRMGQEPREIRCMEVLRDLVVGERGTVTPTFSTVFTCVRIVCKSPRWP